jgi:tripartite-type tricarboxylate transporter receptor subunit TctC
MTMRIASILIHSFILFTVSTFSGFADDFPSKPIKIIVPFPVGGSADIGTRKLGALVSERLGQPVVIDNRPGAGGNIGTAVAAKSPPDGYTLVLILNTTVGVNPHAYANPGFNPLTDLAPICTTVKYQGILVTRTDSPIKTVADLLQQAKAQPGKLSYASAGVGSPQHLMTERLKQSAGIDLAHIPYKGEAQYFPDLLSGQVDVAFGYSAATLPQLKSGKLRALAVSSATRHGALTDVPTLAETGISGYDESGWGGIAAPAATPPERLQKLEQAFLAAMHSPDYHAFVDSVGNVLVAGNAAETGTLLKADYERYGKIVKSLGLRVD